MFIVQVGEEHQYYLPMLVLIVSSIVLQVSFNKTILNNFLKHRNHVKVLNALAQVIMGPLSLDKEEFKSFLNAVNYISMFISYGIVGIDALKAIFFPESVTLFKK